MIQVTISSKYQIVIPKNVRRQVSKIRSHPWIPSSIPVRGFVFDVKTGKLKEVK